MPFDDTGFYAPSAFPADLFPIWSKHGWRLLIKTCFRQRAGVVLRASAPGDTGIAVVHLLQEAKGLIEDRENWGQVLYLSLSWRRCAVGALRAAARSVKDPGIAWSAHALLQRIAQSRGFDTIEVMNDRSSHRDVLRAFDEAIALARRSTGA
jgi:hypothetical protein